MNLGRQERLDAACSTKAKAAFQPHATPTCLGTRSLAPLDHFTTSTTTHQEPSQSEGLCSAVNYAELHRTEHNMDRFYGPPLAPQPHA
jgi:hypothetical protein